MPRARYAGKGVWEVGVDLQMAVRQARAQGDPNFDVTAFEEKLKLIHHPPSLMVPPPEEVDINTGGNDNQHEADQLLPPPSLDGNHPAFECPPSTHATPMATKNPAPDDPGVASGVVCTGVYIWYSTCIA